MTQAAQIKQHLTSRAALRSPEWAVAAAMMVDSSASDRAAPSPLAGVAAGLNMQTADIRGRHMP